jgi:type IV pilus assembly protein PilN
MIRINLLPTRDAPRRQAAVIQVVVVIVLLVVTAITLITVDSILRSEIAVQVRSNALIQTRIDGINRQIRDHDQIRTRIEEIEQKQSVIDELQAGRTGPVFVMVELAKVMSRNGTPTIDHDHYMDLVRRSPGQAFDPTWDGRRLWLGSFTEENREVELNGSAMSHEDVAEFLRRLSLSDFFYEVILIETRAEASQPATEWAAPLVTFQVRCRLRYSGRPDSGQEAGTSAGTPATTGA